MIQGKEQTIIVRISRDDLIRSQNKSNEVIIGATVMRELRLKGVPIIGLLTPFCIEYGTLTVTMEEGLDGDEFVYKWVGVPLDSEMRQHQFTFKNGLAAVKAKLQAERAAKKLVEEDEM